MSIAPGVVHVCMSVLAEQLWQISKINEGRYLDGLRPYFFSDFSTDSSAKAKTHGRPVIASVMASASLIVE